jgi:hypothetical protein
MAEISVPSVGRMVHYRSYGSPGGEYQTEARAAVVTGVVEPGNPFSPLWLAVLNPHGIFFGEKPIEHGKGPGQWSWPPYVPPIQVSGAPA